jgi:cytidylate kinase
MTKEAAGRRVHESDRGRIDYHRKYFKIDPTDPNHYDLTINTEHLSDKQAAELIVAAYRRRPAGSG